MACDMGSHIGDHSTISSSDSYKVSLICYLAATCLPFTLYSLHPECLSLARWILGAGSGSVGTKVWWCVLFPLASRGLLPEREVPGTGSWRCLLSIGRDIHNLSHFHLVLLWTKTLGS